MFSLRQSSSFSSFFSHTSIVQAMFVPSLEVVWTTLLFIFFCIRRSYSTRCCSYIFSSRNRCCFSPASLRLTRRLGKWRLFFSKARVSLFLCINLLLLLLFLLLLFLLFFSAAAMMLAIDAMCCALFAARAPYPHRKCFAQCLCPSTANAEHRQLLPSFLEHWRGIIVVDETAATAAVFSSRSFVVTFRFLFLRKLLL